MSISRTWGTSVEERARAFPCDRFLDKPDLAAFRGVTVSAPPAMVYRWLCQLRIAPYSYDWIDNWGRRSPRELVRGLDLLEVGQPFMTIFRLVDFEPGLQITLRTVAGSGAERVFGRIVLSYCVVRLAERRCRLLVKLLVRYPAGWRGRLVGVLLPWGDLIMMRRQLLNLKHLSERKW